MRSGSGRLVVEIGELTCAACGARIPSGARFCPACGTPVPADEAVVPGPGTAVPRPQGSEGDEIRPITALFADVVGSTALGERLGPDEVKALVGECVTRMSRAVEEFGGTVQAYMGDGICAYFGVPAAHEDDEERAARAALRILQVVAEYRRDIEAGWGISGFNVRVGINAGQVAVGPIPRRWPSATPRTWPPVSSPRPTREPWPWERRRPAGWPGRSSSTRWARSP